MSRFRKIKRKKDKIRRGDYDKVCLAIAETVFVDNYRKSQLPREMSWDLAFEECENKGYIRKRSERTTL